MIQSDADECAANGRRGSAIVLGGIVVGLVALNVIAAWLIHHNDDDWLQSLLIGGWAVLACGPLATRMPLVVPCLLLLYLAPLQIGHWFDDMARFEIVILVSTVLAIFLVAMLISLVVRRFLGFRIDEPSARHHAASSRIRFGIKYLFSC